ncbi:hypothetical protein [Chelativorans sp. YIM 93263]|uniref:hypothetical protein n=1 Tax=Chelativorans sp. YIM 93263 TaxID=2906648 RepID=UPI0023788832|nr:hypothetical protein [Chelativorans sp. YIM 93263]
MQNAITAVVFSVVLGAMAWEGYKYVDHHWPTCSMLHSEQQKLERELAERRRLEEAGHIQPGPDRRILQAVRQDRELPTYEEYKEGQEWRSEATERLFDRWEREKECGLV